MSLDLNKLANKLDEALIKETTETLTKFLNDKRMTNETKQTAVEWLEKEIINRGPKDDNPPKWLKQLFEKAKEMEKEQMIEFALECQEMFKHQIIEKFNETYGGNK